MRYLRVNKIESMYTLYPVVQYYCLETEYLCMSVNIQEYFFKAL